MSFQGHVQNGVVVFDEPVSLPDGTSVRVEPVAAPGKTLAERFKSVREKTGTGLFVLF